MKVKIQLNSQWCDITTSHNLTTALVLIIYTEFPQTIIIHKTKHVVSSLVQYSRFSELAKQFDVAWLAVRVVSVFLESAFVKQLEAEGTCEVFWVPFLPHGSNTLACREGEAAGIIPIDKERTHPHTHQFESVHEMTCYLSQAFDRRHREYLAKRDNGSHSGAPPRGQNSSLEGMSLHTPEVGGEVTCKRCVRILLCSIQGCQHLTCNTLYMILWGKLAEVDISISIQHEVATSCRSQTAQRMLNTCPLSSGCVLEQ